MAKSHHIFLVPGFFGFASIGELLYFAHVRHHLREACARLDVTAEVHTVQTHPTSSLRRRAGRLLAVIRDEAGGDHWPIHLVGHSSGGLDARLLVSPGVSLHGDLDVEQVAKRVRSVVMVSTPNYGTPVASFFASLFGQKLLQLLSLCTVYVLRFGRLPSSVLFRLGTALTRVDDLVGRRGNGIEQLFNQLLCSFSPERRESIEQFLGEISADQGLMSQLTPEGMDVFNATTRDRPGIRYGSALSCAHPPGLFSSLSVGLDPYGQATHAIFYGLHGLASHMPQHAVPHLDRAQEEALLRTYGMVPDKELNDGVVPTISQVWGQVVHAARADHLDVLGHFGDPSQQPPNIDWVSSGTGFSRRHFEALWNDVASFIADRGVALAEAPPSRLRHLLHHFYRRRSI